MMLEFSVHYLYGFAFHVHFILPYCYQLDWGQSVGNRVPLELNLCGNPLDSTVFDISIGKQDIGLSLNQYSSLSRFS